MEVCLLAEVNPPQHPRGNSCKQLGSDFSAVQILNRSLGWRPEIPLSLHKTVTVFESV